MRLRPLDLLPSQKLKSKYFFLFLFFSLFFLLKYKIETNFFYMNFILFEGGVCKVNIKNKKEFLQKLQNKNYEQK